MSQRGNMFANREYTVRELSYSERIEYAKGAFAQVFKFIPDSQKDGDMPVMMAATGAKIGFGGKNVLSEIEKNFVDEVFSVFYLSFSNEELHDVVCGDINDGMYNLLEYIARLGNNIAISMLDYILCFAYCDGEIDDEIAHKLENIFALNLIADFAQSGMESVPAPRRKVTLSTLESEIVQWLKDGDKFSPLKNIQEYFSDYTQQQVKDALESLVEKEIVYGGENIVGRPYGLVDSDIEGAGLGAAETNNTQRLTDKFPIIVPIEGTGYLGRKDRIEFVKQGDKLILKADYNSQYYSPVAIEVFNDKNETLGFLADNKYSSNVYMSDIAKIIDNIEATVESVTPVSKRRKNAKYALMDVKLSLVNVDTIASERELIKKQIKDLVADKGEPVNAYFYDGLELVLDYFNSETGLYELDGQTFKYWEDNMLMRKSDIQDEWQILLEEIGVQCQVLHIEHRDDVNSDYTVYENKVKKERALSKSKKTKEIFTFTQGHQTKGVGYTIAIPDGFKSKNNFKQNNIFRDFMAWYPDIVSISDVENAEIALMPAEIVEKNNNPDKLFEVVQPLFKNTAEKIGFNVAFKNFKNGKITGGYVIQTINVNCVNYHCIIGEKDTAYQFRVIFNKKYARKVMDEAVESWLKTFEIIKSGSKNAKLNSSDSAEKTDANKADEIKSKIRKGVLRTLSDGKEYTIGGLQKSANALKEYTNQRINSVVTEMETEGRVTRIKKGKVSYFYDPEVREKILEEKYRKVVDLIETTDSIEALEDLEKKFIELGNYKDSERYLSELKIKVKKIRYKETVEEFNSTDSMAKLGNILFRFRELGDYEDAPKFVAECESKLKKATYDQAVHKYETADTVAQFDSLKQEFTELGNYKKAPEYVSKCEKRSKYFKAVNTFNKTYTITELKNLKREFQIFGDYREAVKYLNLCVKKIEQLEYKEKESKYLQAVESFNSAKTVNEYEIVKKDFEHFKGFLDSNKYIFDCDKSIEQIKADEQRKSDEQNAKIANRKRKVKKFFITILIIIFLVFLSIGSFIGYRAYQYNRAVTNIENGEYDVALQALENISKFNHILSSDPEGYKTVEIQYNKALCYMGKKEYLIAVEEFEVVKDYNDSKDKISECKYLYADELFEKGEYKEAASKYNELGAYKDSKEKYQESTYILAVQRYESEEYLTAIRKFNKISRYKDSAELLNKTYLVYAEQCYNKGNYKDAVEYYERISLGEYKTNPEFYKESSYNYAIEQSKNYTQSAITRLESLGNYKDSKAKINELKYQYVVSHKDDRVTGHKYLTALKAVGYKDSAKLYKDMFSWKATFVFNNSESSKSDYNSVSKYNKWYSHYAISGGEPNASTKLKAVCIYPNGSSSSSWTDYTVSDGDTGWWSSWYTDPYLGKSGIFTIKLYDETGNLIGQDSVEIY